MAITSSASVAGRLQGVQCDLLLRNGAKFKGRYQMLRFSDKAKVDDGTMWPSQCALSKFTATDETKITAPVK